MSHCRRLKQINQIYRPARLRTSSYYLLQKQRFANLAKFKASVYKILIATDVAAR